LPPPHHFPTRRSSDLLAAGRAYEKDGAIWFRLLGDRHTVFDDHRKKEVEKVKSPPVVIEDRIRGRVERAEDEDFVIFRSDGNPVDRKSTRLNSSHVKI